MTSKEKAKELVDKFTFNCRECDFEQNAKTAAMSCVDEIEKALTEYGETTFELQNMESEFRFLDKVREEIKNL